MPDKSEDSKRTDKVERKKFKAEVKQVLDIVINSLYTHKEIFVRELISNASDALEKMRYKSLTVESFINLNAPYEIRINVDDKDHTLTITDTGIGMTHDELVTNLGTIARSGTIDFLNNLKNKDELSAEIIGKFGVGFYSVFMAAVKVRVLTRSYILDESGYEWVSDGVGDYKILKVDDLPRGTSVIIELKEDAYEYEKEENLKNIIAKYSNFVPYPIYLKNEKVNTVQAIWLKSTSDVSDEDYKEFFSYISPGGGETLSKLHLNSDAPIQFSALLYVPSVNLEQFGFTKFKPSVNLYCKKVLIQQNSDKLLPEYFRFITGVVDSADLPLNISRETLQDNTVFRKLSSFLTRRMIKHFAETAKNQPEDYKKIWEAFGRFFKEGITSDFENRKDLTPLLRFNSSKSDNDGNVSFEEYTKNMKDDQKSIYYLNGRSKEEIENGPYMETFVKQDIEVLYCYDPLDDFVMTSLIEFEGKKLISADAADIDLPEDKDDKKANDDDAKKSVKNIENFTNWMKDTIGESVKEVRESKRLMDRPAIIVNPDSNMTTTMKRIMKNAGKDFGIGGERILEINPDHRLVATLKSQYEGNADKDFLQSCVKQIYDNALAEAGLLDDPQNMVERVYSIMERALGKETNKQ
jgi:molecular chaperone HtpG